MPTMKIAVLGTGSVGRALAGAFSGLGHEVLMGTRSPQETLARTEEPSVKSWLASNPAVTLVGLAEAAAESTIVINATSGEASLEALRSASAENLDGKVLIDVANPLDFSSGFPPNLLVSNTDSLGEVIQRTFPKAKVVKTLNTVNADLMISPGKLASGEHHVFVSGDDDGAKATVTGLLSELGWKYVVDLGDISTARGPEMYLALWVRLLGITGKTDFNIRLVT